MKLVSRASSLLFALALAASLCACSAKEGGGEGSAPASEAEAAMDAAPAPSVATTVARGSSAGGLAAEKSAPTLEQARRFIALSHQWVLQTESAALQPAFDDAVKRCEAAGCEVLSASLVRGDEYTTPSANLSARIPPQALDAFVAGLERGAKVIQHQRQAEDKTAAVVDAEARIANLTELRDRLRAMVASRPGNIKDVLEVERQLSETQTQLDSIRGVRKALANETEKVAINIQFQSRPSISEQSFFAPIVAAWNMAGNTLMQSIAALISFIAAVLPWLVVVLPVGWGLRALWRKRRVR